MPKVLTESFWLIQESLGDGDSVPWLEYVL